MTKVKIVCSHCGSENVLRDAYARWNKEIQDWELANVFDKPSVCESETCDGGETRTEEVPVTD